MSLPESKSLAAEVETLDSLRAEIDAIEEKLIELLMQHSSVVERVGRLKRSNGDKENLIRPGREAEMLRRIYEKFRTAKFSPQAAASIWRQIISGSLAIEMDLSIAVSVPDPAQPESLMLAREFFGSFTKCTPVQNAKRAMSEVLDKKASVAVLPYPSDTPDALWWTEADRPPEDWPRIFAILPFTQAGRPRHAPQVVAVGRVPMEATSNDQSFWRLAMDAEVSTGKLSSWLEKAGLEMTGCITTDMRGNHRLFLLTLKGFINPEHDGLKHFIEQAGPLLYHYCLAGVAGVPIT